MLKKVEVASRLSLGGHLTTHDAVKMGKMCQLAIPIKSRTHIKR